MGLIVILNLVCLVIAWFWSDEWRLRGKLTLTGLFAGGIVAPALVADAPTGTIVFIVWQLALGLYFCFKLGIAGNRAYGWGS